MLEQFRKHIAVLLAFSIIFFQLPAVAFAEDTDFSYSVENDEVTITSYNGSGGEVVVPDTIDAKPVVAIGDSAFSDETSITSIVIPESVTIIGDQAFSGCTSLEKATVLNRSADLGGEGIFDNALLSDAIYGFDGSTAQTYANTLSLPFHILYTVTFNASGGSPADDIIVPSGSTFTRPDDPLCDGYAFAGWYDNDTYAGEAWDFTNDTVSEDITLHAKWTAPPAVPQSVTAVSASYNSIRISWDAVSGADGYTVSRSTPGTDEYSDLPATTATSVTDTGLNTGQVYSYKVKANSIAGDSAYSEPVSAKPELDVPQSVTAVSASYNSIRISWDAVSGADGYTVSRLTPGTGEYSDLPATTATSVTDTGLNTGQVYYYKVKANNIAGSSAYSEPVSAKPELDVPQSVKAVSTSYNSIRLSWNAVPGANGYSVWCATSSTGTYWLVTDTAATSYTHTGRTTGKTYFYKVKAYRTVGTPVYSPFSAIVSAKPVPASPSSVKAVSTSYNSIRLSWDAVSEANGYSVWCATSSTGTYCRVADTTSTRYTHTGRTTGKTYFYKVKAYRTVATTKVFGLFSGIASTKTVPATPSSVKAASFGYTGIKVSWNAAPGAYGYLVYRASSSNGTYAAIVSTRRTSYTDNFLKLGKTYYYKVVPYCVRGSVRVCGGSSKVSYSKPGTANVYDRLVVVAKGELGYEEVKAKPTDANGWTKYAVNYPIWKYGAWCACFVTWCAKKGNVLNKAIPQYAWVLSGKAWYKARGRFIDVKSSYVPKKGDVIFFHEPGSPTSIGNHTGFVEAYNPATKTIYTIEGNIHDSVDCDIHGRYDAYVTGFGVNGGTSLGQVPVVVPLQAKAVSASFTSITVSWADTYSTCTYNVYRATALGGAYTYLRSTTSGSYIDKGLTTGKTYYYKVRAYRVVDGTKIYSVYTQPLRATATLPVSAASAGYDSIKVRWKAVSNATGYALYRATSSGGMYTRIKTLTGTSYTDTGLTTGKTYYYKVRAYCVAGMATTYGSYSSYKYAEPIPAKPALTAKSAGYNSVRLSWTSVPGRTGYALYRATSKSGTYKKIKTLTGTSYTTTGLTTGKTYYYKMRAYRKVGSTNVYGNYSSYKYAKPVPSKPSSVKAVRASSRSIKVTWSAVSGATKYQVYRATSKTGKYSLVATTPGRSFTNAGLTTGKVYYYKVRAYHLEGGTKVYGSFSSVVFSKP